jgi:hypothetical protein
MNSVHSSAYYLLIRQYILLTYLSSLIYAFMINIRSSVDLAILNSVSVHTGVQEGVKRSSMRDIIASPSQISTSPSSGGPCYNKRGTNDRKWAE